MTLPCPPDHSGAGSAGDSGENPERSKESGKFRAAIGTSGTSTDEFCFPSFLGSEAQTRAALPGTPAATRAGSGCHSAVTSPAGEAAEQNAAVSPCPARGLGSCITVRGDTALMEINGEAAPAALRSHFHLGDGRRRRVPDRAAGDKSPRRVTAELLLAGTCPIP